MLTVLILYVFYVSNVNVSPLTPTDTVPKPAYMIPPSMVSAEFSNAAACEAAAQAMIAQIKAQAAPNVVAVGYKCNKKA